MYIPAAFRQDDRTVLHDLIRTYSFGLLVTAGPDGPFVSHIPFLLDPTAGDNGTLYGHLARPNPQSGHFAGSSETLAVFAGPHGYISPGWYERRDTNVPTWNYAAVHAYGRPAILEDAAAIDGVLSRLTGIYEAGLPEPWSLDELQESRRDGMRRGIVAFALPIARLEGKFKLSQNKTAGDRAGAIAALQARDNPDSHALAGLMADL
jgi:transcriptional regulator